MGWEVIFHPEFYMEFKELPDTLQDNLLAKALVIEHFGPQLGRPHVDTLHGSKYRNMKELRLETIDGLWRVAFIFDPSRKAVLLIAGNKSGRQQSRFYKTLIRKADLRYDEYLTFKK